MIKNLLDKTFLTLALSATMTLSAHAIETVPVSTVEPAEGVQTQLGSMILTFSEQPSPNYECQEPAVLSGPNGLEYNVSSGSGSVQTNSWDLLAGQGRIVFSQKKITAPGDYTVNVPEGFFVFDGGKLSEAYTATYNIIDSSDVLISPTPGYPEEIPTVISITFPGVEKIIDNHVTPDSEANGSIRFDSPLNQWLLTDESPQLTIEGNVITLKMYDTPPTEPGEYRFIIYAGAITLQYPDGSSKKSGEIIANYILPLIPRPAITPAEGNVYELGEIVLTLEEGCTFGQFMRPPSLFTYPEEGRVGSWTIADRYPRGLREIHLTPPNGKPVITPGTYRFKIGKASFSAVGLDYNLDKPGEVGEGWNGCDYYYEFTILPSPAEGSTGLPNPAIVKELANFQVYFESANKLELNPDNTNVIELRDEYWREVKGYEVSCQLLSMADDEGKSFVDVVVTPALDKEGKYTVLLPEGYLLCNDMPSREVKQDFQVDPTAVGVDEIVENATFDVYSIDGVKVMENVSDEDLKLLPAGLYIAGGRKILKR